MEALGLDYKLLIAQLINFGVLLFVLNKLVYHPVIKIIDDRRKKTAEALEANQKIEERLAALESQEKAVFKEVQIKASEERQRLLALANSEKAAIIAQAKDAAGRETQKGIEKVKQAETQAVENLKKQVVAQMVEQLSQKMSSTDSKGRKYQLLEEILK